MKKTVYILSALTLILGLAFTSCGEEETPDSVVKFADTEVNITTDDLSPVTIDLSIDPAAPSASSVTIAVYATGGEPGTAFTTTPAMSNGEIMLDVEKGATTASLTVTPQEEGIEYDDIEVEFEITSTEAGLKTDGLTGIFSTLMIANNKASDALSIPFAEDFTGMDDGSTDYPTGWEEKVVSQHVLSEAHWSKTSFPGEALVINPWDADGNTDDPAEVWMVSPRISLIDATNPILEFMVDRRFDTWDPNSGNFDPIDFQEYDLKISTDYDGTNFESATWTVFQPAVDAMEANDPGADDLESTGALDISEYNGEVISIGFVYYSASQAAATALRFGDVKVEEAQ